MLPSLRKIGLAAAMAGVIAVGTVTLPDAAHARWGGWGGGWHGGGWRGGGWGWGGFGVGVGTGLLLGAATAPYWGGYGYGPYYGVVHTMQRMAHPTEAVATSHADGFGMAMVSES